MRTLAVLLAAWTAASILLLVTFALGAAAGRRRALLDVEQLETRPDDISGTDVVVWLDGIEERRA